MSRPFIDFQSIKTAFQGALGAMTFGAYHQFTTNKMMELNNEIMNVKHKNDIILMETKHKEDIKMILDKIEQLESKNKSWW